MKMWFNYTIKTTTKCIRKRMESWQYGWSTKLSIDAAPRASAKAPSMCMAAFHSNTQAHHPTSLLDRMNTLET